MTQPQRPDKCHLAAYYFPNYHRDPRNDQWHGSGWTEWELAKVARPRFEGHQQPKVPLWGYEDESDPAVFAKKIQAAADHGIDTFLFDWYWYEDGPYINGGLEKGFLKAENNHRMTFALMWANHDWVDIHPLKYRTPQRVLIPGCVSNEAFERLTDWIIEKYFSHPCYWKIDGKPYFSVYELDKLIEGLGGLEKACQALKRFAEKARKIGLAGIHFNAVVWKIPILPGEKTAADANGLLDTLGFSSVTSYVWVHHDWPSGFPTASYSEMASRAPQKWQDIASEYRLPYYPNVTMGWDSSPRACQSDVYENLGYPFGFILEGNTPEIFRYALLSAREYLLRKPASERILTINAWNEWTEGSYLEPDTIHQMGYLQAIRDVFGE